MTGAPVGDAPISAFAAHFKQAPRTFRDRLLAREQLLGVEFLTRRGTAKTPRYSTTIDVLREHMPELFDLRAERASEVGEGLDELRDLFAEELRAVEKRCADDLAESERRARLVERARAAETAAMVATLRAEVRALRGLTTFPALAPPIDGDRRRSTVQVA